MPNLFVKNLYIKITFATPHAIQNPLFSCGYKLQRPNQNQITISSKPGIVFNKFLSLYIYIYIYYDLRGTECDIIMSQRGVMTAYQEKIHYDIQKKIRSSIYISECVCGFSRLLKTIHWCEYDQNPHISVECMMLALYR